MCVCSLRVHDPPKRVRQCRLLQYHGQQERRVVILQPDTFLEDKCWCSPSLACILESRSPWGPPSTNKLSICIHYTYLCLSSDPKDRLCSLLFPTF